MSVTTYYKWNRHELQTWYPEESGEFSDWTSWYSGTSYSGYAYYSFNHVTGDFSLSTWVDRMGGTYYDGGGSSITETEVEFKFIAGTDEVYYRTRSRSIYAGAPQYGQGAFIEELQSTNSGAYPYNGRDWYYWYSYIGSNTITDSVYSYVKTNCTDGNNGTITASVSGGSGSHMFTLKYGGTTVYDWSATKYFTGLAPGSYVLYGKDNSATSIEYTQTIAIAAAASFTHTKTNCSAYGVSDGSISASGTNGSGTYQYTLYLGASMVRDWGSSGSFTGLTVGTHSLKCRDTANPSVVTSISVTILSPPAFTYTKTDNTSSASPNGSITATAVGGSGLYKYGLNGGALQSSGAFTGLAAGTYTLLCAEQGGLGTQKSFSVEIALKEQSNFMVGGTRHKLFIGGAEYGMYIGNIRII